MNFPFEFHIARGAREKYQFDEQLFSSTANVIFANFHASRVFAHRMNERRDLVRFPEQAVLAGQINAMGLIDEILHQVVSLYRQEINPLVLQQALQYLNERLGDQRVDQALLRFIEHYPTVAVYRRQQTGEDYLEGETTLPEAGSVPNRLIVLEELAMLWLANANPAFSPFLELFDDAPLERGTAYVEIIDGLKAFFQFQPPFGPTPQNLVDMLRSPALAEPYSLTGQLDYIRRHWGLILKGTYLFRVLGSLELIQEEDKALQFRGAPTIGGGQASVNDYSHMQAESERFSPDSAWMPSVVLMAKNAFVWLDQLSRSRQQEIQTLADIPDEELDKLARWGITGLWLIGLWERSQASKQIKQLRGNPDAVASAYSLFDYQIAGDLGGEQAYENLRQRAWQRGIRLASDMVPNHMGIDSSWVVNHPDWFISLPYTPYPSYTFNGPNLSWDNRIGLYLEDHYYDSTDAAVVFKRVDHWSGDTRYIYHGNDGTSMPWNDTAQLNYLLPEVREAVIQTILHVARKFPIIRFDAAMTLAKKHYQRLWFPEPGSGGGIPSRSDYGLTKEQFDAAIPEEFWREVVDRVAREVPDTLLLAEAFWLMEGYFVRTLGMHRVYNSAFMNMLRDEKNQEYRQVMKNTLEFDPEILKRYVNFMNNPDERTAVDQFGKGDKYFGVCAMMITLPGLPMVGHGQIEGFSEKYGMEFRRALWDEKADPHLVERHEREIFPLTQRRWQFAEVQNFLLYDFFTPDGTVNEDVYAYSNNIQGQRSVFIYNNRFSEARGWIRHSAAYALKSGPGDEKVKVQRTLAQGLELPLGDEWFATFRDQISGLEYIRSCRSIYDKGLYFDLHAYQYRVLIDFNLVQDNEWRQYAQLEAFLAGRGVPNIQEALKEIFLQPVHHPLRELVNAGSLGWLIENRVKAGAEPVPAAVLDEVETKALQLLREIDRLSFSGAGEDRLGAIAAEIRRNTEAVLSLGSFAQQYPMPASRKYAAAQKLAAAHLKNQTTHWATLLGWAFTHPLGQVTGEADAVERTRSWFDEWLFGRLLAQGMLDLGLSPERAWQSVQEVRLLILQQDWANALFLPKPVSPHQILQTWLSNADIQRYLQVNRYQGVLWYNREALELFLNWMLVVGIVDLLSSEAGPGTAIAQQITTIFEAIQSIKAASLLSDYQVEKLMEATQNGKKRPVRAKRQNAVKE